MANQSKTQETEPNTVMLINELTNSSIDAIKGAIEITERLSKTRAELKLSNSRTVSVARELKELAKVMALYCY